MHMVNSAIYQVCTPAHMYKCIGNVKAICQKGREVDRDPLVQAEFSSEGVHTFKLEASAFK
jgi:hypothetical protein